ncbi:hypothetical protein SNOG_00556 [Parastagonospora nodorum SN15]|uniref:Uncharacterized protein n=1 Tax=Phaeosphaeria nodorum (strain SN15 / ATCC MYA-4574 / FGSC 10173) TaxID=321614 RepID=Q0V608_PHANO|nr:hypothetical protein SNOG_00556 [Parastagonospora nodorum SN15]EAT92051.1 hypothetical protein SNOG_00556 [Parastagonospora nodorum SN15]
MWIHVFSLTFATAAVNMPHWLINLRNTRRRAHSQTGRFDRKSAPGNIVDAELVSRNYHIGKGLRVAFANVLRGRRLRIRVEHDNDQVPPRLR